MTPEQENCKLREENRKLRGDVKRISEEKRRISEEKKKIEQDYADVKKEFEEYKATHAQTVTELRKALNIKADTKKTSKQVGARKGHKAYTRHIPERIDFIKKLILSRCPDCKKKLKRKTTIRHRYVTDIKLISHPKTTRYDIHRYYCTNCKKIVEPDVPNALPHARFGLGIMLLVMYLRLGLRMPGKKVCEYFQHLYNMHISEGEIVCILRQLVVAYGDYYATLENMVKMGRVKHADSTSWRISGKNYFAWVFISSGIVLYKIRKRNNHKVAKALFGTNQGDKTLVVDRHSAFRTLAELAGFALQLCWSHILDDSKTLAKHFGSEGKYVHRKLKEIFALAKSLNHQGTLEQVEALKGEIFSLMQRHYQHKTVWRFVMNLYHRDVENLFRFVTDPEIDSTNNISERELRELVIIRRISHGSRSTRGAHATAILLSVIQTLRLSKKNVLQELQEILLNPSG